MVGVEIKVDGLKGLETAAARTEVAFAKAVLRAAQHLTGVIRREVKDTFPGGRTGALARSYRERFIGRSGTITSAGSFSDLVYARIQDEGGTITPKSGRYLAVPVGGARVPVGKWPRHYGANELVLIKRKGRDALLAKVSGSGKRRKLKVLFVLKPKVVLRGRRYLDRASVKAEPEVARILEAALVAAVEQG